MKSLRMILVVPAVFFVAAGVAEVSNCHRAQMAIRAELNDTIMVLAQQEDDMVARQDTIRRLEQINYAMAQPLMLVADQKMPGTLLALSVMSMISIAFYNRRRVTVTPPLKPTMADVRLTPMQRQLIELLTSSPNHCVAKRDICLALWGDKDNAEESLYTLVRRTKQVLKDTSAEIVCNRGESYELRTKC